MIRIYLLVFVVLALVSWLTPWLRRLGLGRLPGDLHFRLLGRDWNLPVASTIVLSLLLTAIAKIV
jgi:hypothetical protein